MSPAWRNTPAVCAAAGDAVVVTAKEQLPMREDLFGRFEVDAVAKCYTGAEVSEHPRQAA
jgi:succinate dehydrogenase flavoprotein subunit